VSEAVSAKMTWAPLAYQIIYPTLAESGRVTNSDVYHDRGYGRRSALGRPYVYVQRMPFSAKKCSVSAYIGAYGPSIYFYLG